MWLSVLSFIVYFVIINVSSKNTTIINNVSTKITITAPAQTQATQAGATTTREPVNSLMSIGPESDPLENKHLHKVQVGTAFYSFTCSYPNVSDDDNLPRHWIFKAGEPDPDSEWHPTDAGCVNLTSSSTVTTDYPFAHTLDPLGRDLNLSHLNVNQSGRYWCVSNNYDYNRSASWDLSVYVMSDYYVESIVLLLINGVCFLLLICGFVLRYWKNLRLDARYKLLKDTNSKIESADDTDENEKNDETVQARSVLTTLNA